MKQRSITSLVFLLFSASSAQIQITVSTDKNDYYVGEPIQITVSACNPGADTVTLSWGTACQATYWIDGIRETYDVCIQILTSITIEPYSCYTWPFTDSITQAGLYSLMGEVIGYGYSDLIYITVSEQSSADFYASPLSGCVPLLVQFTDQSTGEILSWQWDFGDGGTSTSQHPSNSYSGAGTYAVSLTVTGPDNSTDTETKSSYIVVNVAPVVAFSADITSGCKPFSVQFSDQSSSNIVSWSWDFGDGDTSTQQNPSHTYQDTGSYSVSLTATGSCGSVTEIKTNHIYVNESPVAAFANSLDSENILTVHFVDQSIGKITSWSWDFGDGGTSTQQNPSHTYANAGMYTVSLTIDGSCGSSSVANTVSSDITVAVVTQQEIPNAFKLGRAYPNPFNPETTIEISLPMVSQLSLIVYDVGGKEIYRVFDGYLTPGNHLLRWSGSSRDGQPSPSGIYIIRMVTPEYSRSIKVMLMK